jgi:tetratricopeptide (TPR) repeat protein
MRAMLALEKSGDAAAAIRHAAKYERIILADLEVSPDPEVVELAERIRLAPSRSHRKSVAGDDFARLEPREQSEKTHPVAFAVTPPIARSYKFSNWQIFSVILAVALIVAFTIFAKTSAKRVDVSSIAVRSFLQSGSNIEDSVNPRQRAEKLYHRARLVAASGEWPGPMEEPLDLFQDAIRIDPTFAAAYAGMADLYNAHGQYDFAKRSALKALAIDSTLAEGYTALAGPLAYSEHRWWAADSALDRATRLNPGYKLGWMRRATIAAMQGRGDDALTYLAHATALDPESWLTLDNTALIKSQVGKLDEALDAFEQAMRLEPSRNDVKTLYGRTLWKAGRRAEAIDMFRASGAVVEAALAANDTSEMRELLKRYLLGELRVDPFRGAMLYLGLGDRDAAFRELRKSRHVIVPRLLKEPPLIWLSDDPRYGQLLAQWNFVPRH